MSDSLKKYEEMFEGFDRELTINTNKFSFSKEEWNELMVFFQKFGLKHKMEIKWIE